MSEVEAAILDGRAYFGDELSANQGVILKYVQPIAALVSPVNHILEVGSWAGNSIVAWDQATGGTADLCVVDIWDYDWDIGGEMARGVQDGLIERLFWNNVRASGIEPRLMVIKDDSCNVLPTLKHNFFDIVFLDGDHRYEGVKADIINAMPLVRDGGILCGDDLQFELNEVDEEVCRAGVRDRQSYIVPPGEDGYHPGITLAVSELFQKVSRLWRLWAVRKVGTAWEPLFASNRS